MIRSCVVRCSLFQQNRFVGTIPDSIASLPAAAEIDFANNNLTGAVPAAFWANPSLTSLYAERLRRRSGTSHGAIAHTRARAQMHTCTHSTSCRRCRFLKGNRLGSLNVPDKNGTCCATTVHVGPTAGPGQPMYVADDGYFYYYGNKSIPIGNITACATDAANPGQRKNTDPNGEERYTFALSAERDCDGNVNLMIQACPPLYPRRARHLPARSLQAPLLAVPYVTTGLADL
jgi:hypothetical protein